MADVPRKKHNLCFSDISFTVKTKKNPNKVIIQDVNGSIESGKLMAIMGPSGAGKTTLINVLTLNSFGGLAQGEVLLNGSRMSLGLFKSQCAVVTQEDFHWAFLTCRETVAYSADLYLSCSKVEKTEKVDALLEELGLTTCADTKVGNMFMKGMSGGQKKRLSIAIALIKKPTLIYLDEPTSGLDSAAAAGVMQSIQQLAQTSNLIVCATIHQPSTSVYNTFDQVMVLSNGKVAYNGSSGGAEDYFKLIGFPMPEKTNPAEFMLDVVNAEFSDPVQVDQILDEWQNSELRQQSLQTLANTRRDAETSAKKVISGNSFCSQVGTLLNRHWLLTVRDPSLYVGRMVMFMMACSFFAVIYIQARDRVQEQALFRLFLIMWLIGVPTSLGVVVVYVYNEEYKAIRKECRNGMVKPAAYLLARMLIEIPMMIILAVCALGVAAYGIANFYAGNFVTMIVTYAVQLWAFEAMAELFAVSSENPLLGMLQFMNNWFSAFLFAGVMVPEKDVIWPFRIFCYILPLRWGLQSMAYIEFSDSTFAGASVTDCTAGENVPGCTYHLQLGNMDGFKCDEGTSILACYGSSGKQVLESIGNNYQSISATDTVGRDVLYVLCIGVFFKLCYVAILTTNVNKASVIKPAGQSKASKANSNAKIQPALSPLDGPN